MNSWFQVADAASPAWPRTYCFAHAGGSAQAFTAWQRELAGVTGLVAVTPPVRAPLEELSARIAERIAAERGGPFLLFGHSLGALIAFEVARRLENGPAHLVASGCVAPAAHPTERMVEIAGLDGTRLVEAVAYYGGIPPELLSEPDLQEFVLPDVRADFRMVAAYRYRPGRRLSCSVTLVNGADDPLVRPADLAGWSADCAAAPEVVWAEGGHFYFAERPGAVIEVLRRAARALPAHVI